MGHPSSRGNDNPTGHPDWTPLPSLCLPSAYRSQHPLSLEFFLGSHLICFFSLFTLFGERHSWRKKD